MRNLSFALTTQAVENRTKTVTRRCGRFWFDHANPGDLISGVRKSQGLKPGEKLERLATIRVRTLALIDLRDEFKHDGYETAREGFPWLTWAEFVVMFCQHMPRARKDPRVTRIEFEYVESCEEPEAPR